jgi:hypothetical protein
MRSSGGLFNSSVNFYHFDRLPYHRFTLIAPRAGDVDSSRSVKQAVERKSEAILLSLTFINVVRAHRYHKQRDRETVF